jgi:cohesin complex subunit SA-1/2
MPELHQWEALAGYLLYDHSSIATSRGSDDINVEIQQAYKLSSGEDIVLLDVLHSSVKQYLQSILEPSAGRRTNAGKAQVQEKQESAAHSLTVLLPRLLSKFESTPQATSSILRLQQLLDIGLINDLQSGEATYSAILDDISKQFTSHSDKKVLAAASVAFRNARSYEQSKDAADSKVQEIWADSVSTLAVLLQGKDVETRGSLDKPALVEVVNTTIRLAELAGVYDCSRFVEARLESGPAKKLKGRATNQQTLVGLLLQLLKRGEPDEDTTSAFVELEDQLCTALVELFGRYFRWKVFGLKTAISANDAAQLSTTSLSNLAMTRAMFVENLTPIIILRQPLDSVRYDAVLGLLELYALFTTVRNMRPDKGELDEDVQQDVNSLVTAVPDDIMTQIMATHERMERSFAKQTRRKIETPKQKARAATHEEEEEDIEKPPEDSDDEGEDSDDDDEADTNQAGDSKSRKKQAALVAEQHLCELTSKIIFAVVGGAVKDDAVKRRLMLNRTKLGKNYSTLLGYLDEKKPKPKPKPKGKAKAGFKPAAAAAKPVVSDEMVLEDDDIDDADDEEEAQRLRELEEDVVDEREDDEDDAHDLAADPVEDDIMGD